MTVGVRTEIDWDRVKQMNLVDVIGSDIQQSPTRKRGGWAFFMCPVHGDKKTASLAVSLHTNTWRCFGGCNTWGDAYDWFKHRHGMTATATYEHLTGERIFKDEDRYVDLTAIPEIGEASEFEPGQEQAEHTTWPIKEYVERARVAPEMAEYYFMGRGISRETVNHALYLLGRQTMKHTPEIPGVWQWSGKAVQTPYYTIPYIWDGQVQHVKMRRDDAWCREALVNGTIPDEAFTAALEVLNDLHGPHNVTEDDLIDVLCGGRFSAWSGGRGQLPYNMRIVARLVDGEITPRHLTYLIILESETDVLYLRDAAGALGYPAIAAKSHYKYLELLASAADELYFIRDNDESGEQLAKDLKKKLGRGKILTPPVGKDASDVPHKALKAWLAEYNIYPMPRAMI